MGGQLDQLRGPHFQRKQPARGMSYSCAQRFISIFGTTYSCESLYSTLKFIKSKYRSVFTDEHLTELVRIAAIKQNILFLKPYIIEGILREPHQ
jgi:hypothetical protein